MFYKTNMVNLAEKFKLSPKFFLISRKVTFFSRYSHYFMGKSCVTVCYFSLWCNMEHSPERFKKTETFF